MDLFVDKSHKLNSENKLNYAQVLSSGAGSLTSGYSIVGDQVGNQIYVSGNAVVIYRSSGIADIHITKDSTGAYMDEFRISATAKKFVLE
jgi:hypothetical protein